MTQRVSDERLTVLVGLLDHALFAGVFVGDVKEALLDLQDARAQNKRMREALQDLERDIDSSWHYAFAAKEKWVSKIRKALTDIDAGISGEPESNKIHTFLLNWGYGRLETITGCDFWTAFVGAGHGRTEANKLHGWNRIVVIPRENTISADIDAEGGGTE